MADPVKIGIELLDAMPEIQLIDLLIKASSQFDDHLDCREKHRAIEYFYSRYRTIANTK